MKKIIVLCMCFGLMLSMIGCSEVKPTETIKETEDFNVEIEPKVDTIVLEENEETELLPIEHSLEMNMFNGVGNWENYLRLDQDGVFWGSYHDLDMGETGEDYPEGTYYWNEYWGNFENFEELNDYSYKMTMTTMGLEYQDPWVDIDGGMKMETINDITGIKRETDYILYLPNTPVSVLPEYAGTWFPDEDISERETTGMYILYSIAEDIAFWCN
jgi:hypothetical protein